MCVRAMWICVCVCARARTCRHACACARACVCASERGRVGVLARRMHTHRPSEGPEKEHVVTRVKEACARDRVVEKVGDDDVPAHVVGLRDGPSLGVYDRWCKRSASLGSCQFLKISLRENGCAHVCVCVCVCVC